MNITLRLLATVALAASMASAPTVAEEPILVTEGSGGVLDLDGARVLRIVGDELTVALRVARPGEMIFEARSRANRREERPVAIWRDRHELEIRRPEGAEIEPLLLEVAISEIVHIDAEISHGRVQSVGLLGGLDLRGSDLIFDARSMGGWLVLEVAGGTVKIDSLEGGVSLEGSEVETTLREITGSLTVEMTDGVLDMSGIGGTLALDVERTSVVTRGVAGRADVQALESPVDLSGFKGGAEIDLQTSPLVLTGCKGEVQVRTDAQVRFREIDGNLRIESRGADVSGAGVSGSLSITNSSATVRVERVEGPLIVDGDDLKLQIKETRALVRTRCNSCDVAVAKATGPIDIDNDYGDVVVDEAEAPVSVASRGGDVRLANLGGGVTVKADGSSVEAAWSKLITAAESRIENEGGDVVVMLPPGGGFRIDAEAPYGRVESSIAELKISADETRAAGSTGDGKAPVLTIRSGGNIYLERGETPGKP